MSDRVTPARPVVHYIPVSGQALAALDRRVLAQRRDAELYARWERRQAVHREREARTRRVALRVAAGFAVVLLGLAAVVVWQVVQFVDGHPGVVLGGLGALALAALLLAGGGTTTVIVVVRVYR